MGPSYRSIHGILYYMLYREQIEDLSKGPHKTIQTIEDLYTKSLFKDPYIGNVSGTYIRGPSTIFNHLKPLRTYIIHIL